LIVRKIMVKRSETNRLFAKTVTFFGSDSGIQQRDNEENAMSETAEKTVSQWLETVEEHALKDHEVFQKYRNSLRDVLLAEQLIEEGGEHEISLSFSGSGDSGNWDDEHDNACVMTLFNHLLNNVVTWDWYNNDGGGGTISWDLATNTINIEGYYNETVQTPVNGRTIEEGEI
jgi:hypothetical protein